MSTTSPNTPDPKQLPGASAAPAGSRGQIVTAGVPTRQMSELPKDELDNLATEFGLSPIDYKTRQELVAAIHDRRQMIAGLDRDAMLDVIRWGRRPILANLNKEQLAQEIVRIKSMRFEGLPLSGLMILASLRGACG
jgi:hypothetical protein